MHIVRMPLVCLLSEVVRAHPTNTGHAGRTMSLGWPGNASGYPRTSRMKWLGKWQCRDNCFYVGLVEISSKNENALSVGRLQLTDSSLEHTHGLFCVNAEGHVRSSDDNRVQLPQQVEGSVIHI